MNGGKPQVSGVLGRDAVREYSWSQADQSVRPYLFAVLLVGDGSGAGRTLPFRPEDQLLLRTDGVTGARDSRQVFYPLDERLAILGNRGAATAAGGRTALLRLPWDDLLGHVGAPLADDALLRVRVPPVT